MNPYTTIVTRRHLEQLRADAAEHRLARAARSAKARSSRMAPVAALKASVTRPQTPSGVSPA
jgi:hypothetical protein